jgi:hypothetical protein
LSKNIILLLPYFNYIIIFLEILGYLMMKARRKVKLISEILDRYDEGVCFYCGGALNRDFEADDYDDGYSPDWCPNCCKNIDPNDDWDQACLEAIDKVIHDEPFKA